MIQPAVQVPSPCVNVCQMDPGSGLCLGCRRTLREIADWLEMSPEDKRAVLERIAQRAHAPNEV
jgi:predicted Fe-S protein YdhL (DUF1289 family)